MMNVMREGYEKRRGDGNPAEVEDLMAYGFSREEAEVLSDDLGWGDVGEDPPGYAEEQTAEDALYRPKEFGLYDQETDERRGTEYRVEDPRDNGQEALITFRFMDEEALYEEVYDSVEE
ncbi:MAG: hypothetical protein SV186_00305 [Candidatus Nanohaloarchaea archaeon]|nr:hypothetical protein [Candidatus Nanohaloarchaea archaeon]